jgi:hypothetical protein
LGIDLGAVEPLLPNVYYVGSDAPLINFGQYPVPRSYPHEPDRDPVARFARFSDEALLFIFYLHCRDQLQERAHAELIKRKFVYDDGRWTNTSDCVFDVDAWRFVQKDELGRIPQ